MPIYNFLNYISKRIYQFHSIPALHLFNMQTLGLYTVCQQ